MSTKKDAQGPLLDLLVIAYGSSDTDPNDDSRFSGEDQRRVEVKCSPRVPIEYAGNLRRMQDWAQGVVNKVVFDVKHSQRWHCEFCGEH